MFRCQVNPKCLIHATVTQSTAMPTRDINLTGEQQDDAKLTELRTAIDEGDASGVAEVMYLK